MRRGHASCMEMPWNRFARPPRGFHGGGDSDRPGIFLAMGPAQPSPAQPNKRYLVILAWANNVLCCAALCCSVLCKLCGRRPGTGTGTTLSPQA
jgi:hypothetical protein